MKIPDPEVARSLTSRMTVRTEYGFFYLNLINLQLFLASDPSFCGATALLGARSPHCWGFAITLKHTTLGSPSQRSLPHNTYRTHKRHTHDVGGIRTRNPSKWQTV